MDKRRNLKVSLAINSILLIGDLIAVVMSFLLSYQLRKYAPLLSPLGHGIDLYLRAWAAILLWPLMMWREGLYPGYWLSMSDELRRVLSATTLAGLLATAGTFITKTGPQYSRPIVVGIWLISLFIMPATRYILKRMMRSLGLTGPRAVILGGGVTGQLMIDSFMRQRLPVVRPVAIFDDDPEKVGLEIRGVPIIGSLDQAIPWASEQNIETAVVAMPGMQRKRLVEIIEEQNTFFSRIIVVPDLFGVSASDTQIHEVQGILTLELRNNLLYLHNRVTKRLIDIALLIICLLIVVPIGLLIALAIFLESSKPVLFKHKRVGKGGREFIAWKYRTMVEDAEGVLKQALSADPELKREWDEKHKLKHDPRLTRVGWLVRRLSFDELPQLWNVLKGEMSLVGPRPITEKEIARYGDGYDLYKQVLPGLTGLWQVSGRSDLSYEERVWLDTHYVRNWSIWLDIVILVRTVWVVLAGIGAY